VKQLISMLTRRSLSFVAGAFAGLMFIFFLVVAIGITDAGTGAFFHLYLSIPIAIVVGGVVGVILPGRWFGWSFSCFGGALLGLAAIVVVAIVNGNSTHRALPDSPDAAEMTTVFTVMIFGPPAILFGAFIAVSMRFIWKRLRDEDLEGKYRRRHRF